jgi:hypothetical protein
MRAKHALVFCAISEGYMSRGPAISWIYVYLNEAEVLYPLRYPPLTCLYARKREAQDKTPRGSLGTWVLVQTKRCGVREWPRGTRPRCQQPRQTKRVCCLVSKNLIL